MELNTILEGVKRWNPEKILTEPDEVYPTLREGEVVVDFNDELMMSYSKDGFWQISYGDWVGDYENPLPVIDLIMGGYLKPVINTDEITKLVLLDNQNKAAKMAI
ncbi:MULTISPECIES: hypothetical protein [Erysipelotrichaceae]|uniref:Phage protein n=1 Tax=Dubosiella newyorkensis TaxID=1862672 RepID=A0A1U7NML6_9FIRM|nr:MULTISPECIES: hypothetical protein [Erysipelotrichaceae]OLU46467.1 hypothetical protein BO225_06035 [Dubosiella newyorkensis]